MWREFTQIVRQYIIELWYRKETAKRLERWYKLVLFIFSECPINLEEKVCAVYHRKKDFGIYSEKGISQSTLRSSPIRALCIFLLEFFLLYKEYTICLAYQTGEVFVVYWCDNNVPIYIINSKSLSIQHQVVVANIGKFAY